MALRWWDSKLIFLVLLQLMNCPDILNGHRYRILSNYVFKECTNTKHTSRLHAGLCSTHMFFHQINAGCCHLVTKVELDLLPLNRHAHMLH